MSLAGIDVSRYQGTIDWPAVSGVAFVWIKSSEGTGYRDPTYARNRAGAKARAIPSGAYHFLRPFGDPREQARFWRDVAGRHPPGDLRPAADVEVPGFSAAWLHAFMDEAERAFEVRPVLYSYRSYVSQNPWLAEFTGYPLWIAAYSSTPPASNPWGSAACWQYTDFRPTPGITAQAPDGNLADSLVPLLVPAHPAPPQAPQPKKDRAMWLYLRSDGSAWTTDGTFTMHVETPSILNYFRRAGVPWFSDEGGHVMQPDAYRHFIDVTPSRDEARKTPRA